MLRLVRSILAQNSRILPGADPRLHRVIHDPYFILPQATWQTGGSDHHPPQTGSAFASHQNRQGDGTKQSYHLRRAAWANEVRQAWSEAQAQQEGYQPSREDAPNHGAESQSKSRSHLGDAEKAGQDLRRRQSSSESVADQKDSLPAASHQTTLDAIIRKRGKKHRAH